MGNRVYVGNLSYNTSQDTLRQSFSKSGTVTDVKIITDRMTGQNRGFGFVSFENDEQAFQAIQDWNGQELDGRRLTVNEAQDRRPNTGFGGPSNGGPRPFNDGPRRPFNDGPINNGPPPVEFRKNFGGDNVYRNYGDDKPAGGGKGQRRRNNEGKRGRRGRSDYEDY